MSSILTNNGAMVALQTLKATNANLAKAQDEIATGKSVSNAKDNAAIWSISKVMEAEVDGFKAISSSLGLGSSIVSTAQAGAEGIGEMLKEMRTAIISAQSLGADDTASRAKVQAGIDALKDQIKTAVSSSQLNGMNLLDGSTASVDFLASLDRSASGAVTSGNITVAGHNLAQAAYTGKAAFTGTDGVSTNADSAAATLDAGADFTLVIDGTAVFAAGDSVSITLGNKTVSYTFSAADVDGTNTPGDMAAVGLKNAIEALGIKTLSVTYDSADPGQLVISNADYTDPDTSVVTAAQDMAVSAQFKNAGAGTLGLLDGLSVGSLANAQSALANIETMIQDVLVVASDLGSAGKRIDLQKDFLSKLTDSFTSGIGALVDADMEAASARLQALQTQQQLGIQALSIANQAPQTILSLFR